MKNLTGFKLLFSLIFAATVLSTHHAFAKKSVKEKILIFTKEQFDFERLTTGLVKQLETEYAIQTIKINKSTNFEKFKTQIEQNNPNLMVLIDNQSVGLSQEYYKQNPKSKLPAVALMGLNYKKILQNDAHICGIAYEVSPFSLFTQFRALRADKKLKKVLTFYRSSQFTEAVQDAIRLAKLESIELVAKDVEQEKDLLEYLNSVGKKEINSGEYDAVYVILDSVLLRSNLFENFWVPVAKKSKIPFLVGTQKFVDPAFNFAAFGLSPNLQDLASQAAQMIESILAGDKCQRIEDLVGVDKFLNETRMQELKIKMDENSIADSTVLRQN